MDREQLAPIRDYVTLLDVVEDGHDFRHRYGSAAGTAVFGHDLTGALISELPASSYIAEVTVALFRAAYRRGDTLYVERTVEEALFIWHALILPLADDIDKVSAFLVGAIPVSTAGLPITTEF